MSIHAARFAILLAGAVTSFLTSAAGAQSTRADSTVAAAEHARVGSAHVVSSPPRVDGRLDEAVWQSGKPFAGFIQRELREGEPVSERTEVRLLTDGAALYVGAWLYDRQPGDIVPGEKVRDGTLTNSDYFALIVDTYLDRQNGFVFATTPAGIEHDGQVVREGEGGGVFQSGQTRAQAGSMGGFNLNWDGSWTVATSSDSVGWYAEFRIPFSTLRYGGGASQTWGLNFARGIRRKNEEAFWSFIPRHFNLYRLSRAGTLADLQVPVRRVATVTPYVLGGVQRNFLSDHRTRRPNEFGADIKYGLTPSLTLDLTYNTDFAQVEVDEQRTNLTRFPLFFPEKRPFFLENAGVFTAGTPQAVDLFFSRRIGIDTLGNPVPILGGGRITGRVGGLTVGLLQIFTDRVRGVQSTTSYSVARASRELSTRSRVGAIAVQRLATDDSDDRNRAYGLDGRVGLGEAWTIDWWGAMTETPALDGDDFGYSARAAYQTGRWNNSVRFVQVGEDFNPEVGFLNRFGGYRFYDVGFMRTVVNPKWKRVKQWNPHGNYRSYFGLDGFYQSGQIHVDVTEVDFANGGRFGPEINFYHEGLQQPFTIARDVTLPAGSYDYWSLGLDLATNPSTPLSLSFRGDFGPFYNGTRNGGNVTITARRGASITSSLLLDYNDVHLDEGAFERYLIGTRLGYFFTPRVFVQTLVQYNNQARVWAANARFGWLSTAGTGLFVVFNEGQEADGFFRWQRAQARSLVIKYTRQFGTGG
ncbi:MAG: carbohydrate binding family 9 domain-containing protein [Anaerolineae bacterium]|nr:carbohydrate binding family 9 domain-containing protein [Gemmatimonadaceae bacterium]